MGIAISMSSLPHRERLTCLVSMFGTECGHRDSSLGLVFHNIRLGRDVHKHVHLSTLHISW